MELRTLKPLRGVRAVAIDTAPFIYYIEENKAYIDALHRLFTLVGDGRISAYTSVVTLIEVLTKPIEENNDEIAEKYTALLTDSENLEMVDIDKAIAAEAARLRAKYHIKTPDAIQIAAGIANGAELFITNDVGLKRVKEIKVIALDDLAG